MSNKFIALTVVFAFLLATQTLVGLASGIVVENAAATWKTSFSFSAELVNSAGKVSPRVITTYSSTMYDFRNQYSDQLISQASEINPRIISEYSSSIHHIANKHSEQLDDQAGDVSNRVTVAHADNIGQYDLYKGIGVETHSPTAKSSDLSGQPNEMQPETTYSISGKYYDPDGRGDLKHCYLQLNHPSKPLTMMWNQTDETYSTWEGEEGENYLTIVDVQSTKITDEDEGYQLTWEFKLNSDWPEVKDAIDFGVFAKDDNDLTSGWSYDATAASFSTEGENLVAHMEYWSEEDDDWVHWDSLSTDQPQLELILRGTESENKSDKNIVNYEWDFGDGETADGEYVTHTYSYSSDPYNITLTVTNESGNIASDTNEIEVRGQDVPDWRKDIQKGDIIVVRHRGTLACGMFYTHTAIYIGNNEVIEAMPQPEDSNEPEVHTIPINQFDGEEFLQLLRVDTTEEIKDDAISFAEDQIGDNFEDPLWRAYLGKSSAASQDEWYCSELAWAAYKNQGVDIEFNPDWKGVTPDEISLDNDKNTISTLAHSNPGQYCPRDVGTFYASGSNSPVNLQVESPDGSTITLNSNAIEGAYYIQDYRDGDLVDLVIVPSSGNGNFQIKPKSKSGVPDTKRYSLRSKVNGAERTVVEEKAIKDTRDDGYSVDSSNNTPAGQNIELSFADSVDLSFERVDKKGNSELSTTAHPPTELPPDLSFLNQYYKFSTTATTTGDINITINYADTDLDSSQEQNLKLYKFSDDGKIENITTSNDPQANTVTGKTDSFSYFGLGYWSLSPNWNIISPPGVPVNPDPATSLEDDLEPLTLYYDYLPGEGYTNYPNDTTATQLSWKKGYWTMVSEETPADIEADVPSGEATIELNDPGWHMIGVPYSVNWSQASFSDPSDFQTDGAGNVRLVAWSPEDKKYYNHYSDQSYVLSPWSGYWVYVKSTPASLTISESNSTPSSLSQRAPLPQSVNRSELDYPPLPQKIKDSFQAFAYPNPVMQKDEVTFAARIPELQSIRVTVTNTAGEVVYDSGYKSGSKLSWDLKSSSGSKVANGIYLYKIQGKGVDGSTQASEVKRLLVLR